MCDACSLVSLVHYQTLTNACHALKALISTREFAFLVVIATAWTAVKITSFASNARLDSQQ